MTRPLRVLMVEDRGPDAELLLRELRRAGFAPEARIVATEADYRSALDSPFDVVLSEFDLPGFDGLAALRILRVRDPDLPFIVVTGALGDENASRLFAEGATDYVLKDRTARLGAAVENAVAHHRAEDERRRIERALAESELYHRLILEHSQDMLVILRADGTPKFHTASVTAVLGRTPAEFEGRSVFEFMHDDDRPSAFAVFAEALARPGVPLAVEFRMRHRDGSWVTFEALGTNLVEHPVIGGILVTARDVTRRVEAERALRLQGAALSAAANAIVITGTDGRISWVNPAFTRLTGYTSEEVLDRNPRILKSGAHDRPHYESLWRTILSGEIWHGQMVNRRKDGTLYHEEQTVTPVRENGVVRHFIAIKQDVTERTQAEYRLRQALERAEEADRLKSAFLANMSHEIRTPLNVIIGYNSIITEHCRRTADAGIAELAEGVHRASKRLLATIEAVLDIARIETGSFEVHTLPVRLSPLVGDVSARFRAAAATKHLDLVCDVAEPDATVLFDRYCLERALGNLVDNSIKFTAVGSVTIRLAREDGTLSLSVEDTGIGIDPDYLPRLFVPFTQAESGYSRAFEGNGLGLALARRYLDLCGASIDVRSEKGRGTCFRVSIPRALEVAAPARTATST